MELILIGGAVLILLSLIILAFTKAAAATNAIPDRYSSLVALKAGMRESGVEDVNLIVAIDFTQSNEENGAHSFGGQSLHQLSMDPNGERNPYQRALEACIVSLLDSMDEDRKIPTLAFGDLDSKKSGQGFRYIAREAYGFMGVLDAYNSAVSGATLSGPTSFGPILREAMGIVEDANRTYHILLILCDGQITDWATTKRELKRACKFPLSIIIIGIGDGPWDSMKRLDDDAEESRPWDNVQFVQHYMGLDNEAFALRALQEIPDQFKIIRERGLIGGKVE